MMYVEDKDLNNRELTMLPVRQGCSGGPCACSGFCRTIVGNIDRSVYEEFIKTYVSFDDFFNENKVEHVPPSPKKQIIKSIHIQWPKGADKYKVMMAFKNKLYIDNATYLNKLLSITVFHNAYDQIFRGIADNWGLYKEILDENNVKYNVIYEEERY